MKFKVHRTKERVKINDIIKVVPFDILLNRFNYDRI
jgi:hypothetical protein